MIILEDRNGEGGGGSYSLVFCMTEIKQSEDRDG